MECIVVSFCISKSVNRKEVLSIFHFKGVFAGKIIKSIEISSSFDEFQINEEYILHMKITKVNGNILCGYVLRKKPLKNLRKSIW